MQDNIREIELIQMLREHNKSVDKVNKRLTCIVVVFALVICVMAIYIVSYK